MSDPIRYTVYEDSTVEVRGSDPIELITVPCWKVTRVTAGSMGWHIGKYDSEAAALDVVAALTKSIPHELT